MKKNTNKQTNKSFPVPDSQQVTGFVCSRHWRAGICPCVCGCLCKCNARVCELIHFSIDPVVRKLATELQLHSLNQEQMAEDRHFGGAPHDGGDQCEIYAAAAHIHNCKISSFLSVKQKHVHTLDAHVST